MRQNHLATYIEGLWERLSRHARGTFPQRRFIIEELTHILSCSFYDQER